MPAVEEYLNLQTELAALTPKQKRLDALKQQFKLELRTEGITRAEVELGRAELTLAEGVSQAAIRAAIADAGFAVTAIRILPRTLPTI